MRSQETSVKSLRTMIRNWVRQRLADLGPLVVFLAAGAMKADELPRHDRQGDLLPPGAVARMGTLRFRTGNTVNSVAGRQTANRSRQPAKGVSSMSGIPDRERMSPACRPWPTVSAAWHSRPMAKWLAVHR